MPNMPSRDLLVCALCEAPVTRVTASDGKVFYQSCTDDGLDCLVTDKATGKLVYRPHVPVSRPWWTFNYNFGTRVEVHQCSEGMIERTRAYAERWGIDLVITKNRTSDTK